MALIPQPTIAELINDKMEDGLVKQNKREYLGYSGLGHSCRRKVWYDFRWVKDRSISKRMNRLYKRGDWEEHRIIKDLVDAGVSVHSEQKEVSAFEGHVKGHIDCLLDNVPSFSDTILGEFKTANDKRFKEFVKKKNCKLVYETYYYQAIAYMGELGLKYCLFIVTNKNDESRYIEIIEFDEGEFNYIKSIALDILSTDDPPDKIGDASWYECKYCDYYMECHFNEKINFNCRTCSKGTIENGGKWSCDSNRFLTKEEQIKGCNEYIMLKGLR